MASVTLSLDKRNKRKDGTYTLKLAVNHKDDFLVNLKIYLREDQWENGLVVNHNQRKFLNTVIEERLISVKNLIIKLGNDGTLKTLSAKELKQKIENYNIPEEKIGSNLYLFKDHFEKFVANKKKKSTIETYQYTYNKIKEYTDLNSLTFQDMNLSWMKRFEIHLSESCGVNTRGIHFRNIRSIFNDAIDEELITPSTYPFRKFKIAKEATPKRSLTVEDLITLRDYPCEPHQEKYRDLFMLIFYFIGINTIDLLHAKSITNNKLDYRRAKTQRLYSIEVLPEAKKIIDKYSGENYLLNFLDTYNNYKDFTHRLNENLQEIGPHEWIDTKSKTGRPIKKKVRYPLFPNLTTYYARHTWATIAASLDIPKETIAAALGHGGNSVTDIYINFDQKKIDDANRKVIKYIEEYDSIKKSASQK